MRRRQRNSKQIAGNDPRWFLRLTLPDSTEVKDKYLSGAYALPTGRFSSAVAPNLNDFSANNASQEKPRYAALR
jgi:hypothetical protein